MHNLHLLVHVAALHWKVKVIISLNLHKTEKVLYLIKMKQEMGVCEIICIFNGIFFRISDKCKFLKFHKLLEQRVKKVCCEVWRTFCWKFVLSASVKEFWKSVMIQRNCHNCSLLLEFEHVISHHSTAACVGEVEILHGCRKFILIYWRWKNQENWFTFGKVTIVDLGVQFIAHLV